MNLLVGFYQDATPARMNEFVECIQRNAANPHVESITVFIEDATAPTDVRARFPAMADPKVKVLALARRLTFAHLFDHANRHLTGVPVGIANSDICFDETLALLADAPLDGKFLCLSRWEEEADGSVRHFDAAYSQDAWIFEPPLPRIVADFFLGKPGCENRLAYEAERAGLTLSNPSRSLRARHLHRSAIRHYTERDRLNGPLRFVPPSFWSDARGIPRPLRPSLEDFPSHRGLRAEFAARTHCCELEAMLAPEFGGVVPRRLRQELARAVSARLEGPPHPSEESLATVGYREAMGYTLARLACGVSTHNNDPRPLVSIPPAMAGLQFTQVVSCRAAPVAIEFRSNGRLYVLAAQGWEGYESAAAFLDDAGWREPIPPLRTQNGTVFEPWCLVAHAGERLIMPTQVMLAGAELIRME